MKMHTKWPQNHMEMGSAIILCGNKFFLQKCLVKTRKQDALHSYI